MGYLQGLPNIGPNTEAQLQEVGIHTPEELRLVGSCEAWLRILARDPSACYNRLCGLEGAVQGIKKAELKDEVKQNLKTFYNQHKG